MKIAIIGTGIAGSVIAYKLRQEHDITVFESGTHVGGHANTVDVYENGRQYAVDTGFIVFNDRTYPNFIRLLDEIGQESQRSEMSFSVQAKDGGIEYSGSSLNALFAQRRNIVRPPFYSMIRDILRFNESALPSVENLVAEARKAFGDSIDILVNLVGGLVARKPLAEMDEDFFEGVMKLNVTSTFLTTKCVVPFMGSGSSIVNFASQAGRDGGGPGAAAYATSKGAVMTFTRAMAKEFGPANIRVNCVCPGMIDTTFHDTFTKDEVRKNVAAATPLRREGEASEVADLAIYLASSESSFMTGVSVDINGGMFFS
jgi:3-oxoacyl-[acyl-carrier protein] reductase